MKGLATELRQSLSPARLDVLRTVIRMSESMGWPLYLVGGAPRDLILGRPSKDLDLLVEGDAIQLADKLVRSNGGRIVSHRRFGTAVWHVPASQVSQTRVVGSAHADAQPMALDLITARTESYSGPAHLPHVESGTILDDLRRRDFTMNALAIRLDGGHFGELLDAYGGLDDLSRGVVRVLHGKSFIDDPTRIFRAVRYEKRLAFRMTPRTLELARAAAMYIDLLSAKRVRHELELILLEDRVAAILRTLARIGALRRAHPALPADRRSLHRLESPRSPSTPNHDGGAGGRDLTRRWAHWLMDLPSNKTHSIAVKLELPNGVEQAAKAAGLIQSRIATWSHWRPSRLTRRLDAMPLVAIEAAAAALHAGPGKRMLTRYLQSWRGLRIVSTSQDLRAQGVLPGKKYGAILRQLREAWIDGRVEDAREERALLRRLTRTPNNLR